MVIIVQWNFRYQQVKDAHKKSPYKFIGKLLSYFTDDKQQYPRQGTAFFIGQGVLLTTAHMITNQNNQYAKRIFFYPAQSQQSKRIKLRVKKFHKPKQYYPCHNKFHGPNVYDLALLQINEHDLKKYKQFIPQGYLKLPTKLLPIKQQIDILAAGYISQFNKHEEAVHLYEQTNKSCDQDDYFIFYKHQTTSGQSGMPLLQKIDQNTYKLIGMHKGTVQMRSKDKDTNKKYMQTKKFGIYFNQHAIKLIYKMARQMGVGNKIEMFQKIILIQWSSILEYDEKISLQNFKKQIQLQLPTIQNYRIKYKNMQKQIIVKNNQELNKILLMNINQRQILLLQKDPLYNNPFDLSFSFIDKDIMQNDQMSQFFNKNNKQDDSSQISLVEQSRQFQDFNIGNQFQDQFNNSNILNCTSLQKSNFLIIRDLQKQQFQINLKCQGNNYVKNLCVNKNCKLKQKILCSQQRCKCNKQHAYCRKQQLKSILKIIKLKNQKNQKQIKPKVKQTKSKINQIFVNLFAELTRFKQNCIQQIEKNYQNVLLKDLQTSFYQIFTKQKKQNIEIFNEQKISNLIGNIDSQIINIPTILKSLDEQIKRITITTQKCLQNISEVSQFMHKKQELQQYQKPAQQGNTKIGQYLFEKVSAISSWNPIKFIINNTMDKQT